MPTSHTFTVPRVAAGWLDTKRPLVYSVRLFMDIELFKRQGEWFFFLNGEIVSGNVSFYD